MRAGVSLVSALDLLRGSPPSRSYIKPVQSLLDQLQQGASLTDAMLSLGRGWLPAFDLALIEAGEASGRLDVCFQLLADYYQERARLVRQVLSDLAYPALVRMAVLIFPLQWLSRLVWQGDVVGFVLIKGAVLIPFYSVILLLLYAVQGRHGEWWRAWIERLLRMVPVLGAARFNLALARLSAALEGLINAGISIVEAWPLAAAASGSPSLCRTVVRWRPDGARWTDPGRSCAREWRLSRAVHQPLQHR